MDGTNKKIVSIAAAIAAVGVGYGAFTYMKANGAQRAPSKRLNQALLFIKPHGRTDPMPNFIESELVAAGLEIVTQGQLPGAAIDSNGLIDAHYAAIGDYAMKMQPADLPIPEATKETFKVKFGLAFGEAASSGKLMNAAEAMRRFGWDGNQIGEEFEKAKATGASMKLAPGCYVAKLVGKDAIVVNGFYGKMRAEYVDSKAVVSWMVVSWRESAMSWESFRADVLGATDPTKANAKSIRAKILAKYQDLGLGFVPSMGGNCLHGSASPLEALNERVIWTGAKIATDAFGKLLLAAGISEKVISEMCKNPNVKFEGETMPCFDAVEDTSTTDCIGRLLTLNDAWTA